MDDAKSRQRRLGFGLGKLHHVVSRPQRTRIVLGALDAGFTHFDVAPAYGDGLGEAEAGRILQGRRDSVTLGTKFGIPASTLGARNIPLYFASKVLRKAFSSSYGSEYATRDFSPAAATASVEQSLRRLRTDYLDYLFFHEPQHRVEFDGLPLVIETLEGLKQAGKIRHYGISACTEQILGGGRNGLIGDMVQFELSEQSPSLMQAVPKGSRTSVFWADQIFEQDSLS